MKYPGKSGTGRGGGEAGASKAERAECASVRRSAVERYTVKGLAAAIYVLVQVARPPTRGWCQKPVLRS